MKRRRCDWCGEISAGLVFVGEVGNWYHKGECLTQAHEVYCEGTPSPSIPQAWRKVTETEPAVEDMPCVVALGHGTYDIATSRKDSDWWLKDAYYDGDEAPSYWMPIPDAPRD